MTPMPLPPPLPDRLLQLAEAMRKLGLPMAAVVEMRRRAAEAVLAEMVKR